MKPPPRDPYKILGVPRDATTEAIIKAYRRKARELHPDRNPGEDTAAAFQDATDAYDLLCDPDRRRVYDVDGVWRDPVDNTMAGIGNTLAHVLNMVWQEMAAMGGTPAIVDVLDSMKKFIRVTLAQIEKDIARMRKIKGWAAVTADAVTLKKRTGEKERDNFLDRVIRSQEEAKDRELARADEMRTNFRAALDHLDGYEYLPKKSDVPTWAEMIQGARAASVKRTHLT